MWRIRELVVGVGKHPRPMNFDVTEHEMFIDRVLDSTLYQPLKNYHLLSLGVGTQNAQNYLKILKYFFLFLLSCVRKDFFHNLYAKECLLYQIECRERGI